MFDVLMFTRHIVFSFCLRTVCNNYTINNNNDLSLYKNTFNVSEENYIKVYSICIFFKS